MVLADCGECQRWLAGDRGRSMVITSNMGNGTRFKLSSVLPNVFSKIKGIKKSNVEKLSSSSSALSTECTFIGNDPIFFPVIPRDVNGEHSLPSPVRTFPQNPHRNARFSSSPEIMGQKLRNIRLPTGSPIKNKTSDMSGALSPPQRNKGAAEVVDSECCSYESTMALVPHDGRFRRAVPQAFGRCLIMSHCNKGSTQSDSESSETDSSGVHSRIRHSCTRNAQLSERHSCKGCGPITEAADERAPDRSFRVLARQRTWERRDRNDQIMELRHQPYGGSSPIQAFRRVYDSSNPPSNSSPNCFREDQNRDREWRRSPFPNSSRERSQFHRNQTNSRRQGRVSRRLTFTTKEIRRRPLDDVSFSSDYDLYKMATSHKYGSIPRGHYQSRSTSCINTSQLHMYGGNQDSIEPDDSGYTSGEASYTEDERHHAAASLRREAFLAKSVLNAGDGWAPVQLSRSSHDQEPSRRRASYDAADHHAYEGGKGGKGGSESSTYSRDATLVKTVLNLRSLAKGNEMDRQHLLRLKGCPIDLLFRREDEADILEYETLGSPPHSRRDYFRQKNSRHPSSIREEVEKYTEGRVDYRSSLESFSPNARVSKSDRTTAHEEFGKPVAECASSPSNSERTDKSEMEFEKPCETELTSNGSTRGIGPVHDDGSPPIDCIVCDPPTPHTPRYLERQRQKKVRGAQQQEFEISGTGPSQSPSPGAEAMSPSIRNIKPSSQSIEEFSSGESGAEELSPAQKFQKVRKSSQTPSPSRSQSPQAAASASDLAAKSEAGMQRLDSTSVAVVKASYDPYHDFRESMMEMILENAIRTAEDLEDLLQCYLSLNSSEYHKIIVEVFRDVWGDIFEAQ